MWSALAYVPYHRQPSGRRTRQHRRPRYAQSGAHIHQVSTATFSSMRQARPSRSDRLFIEIGATTDSSTSYAVQSSHSLLEKREAELQQAKVPTPAHRPLTSKRFEHESLPEHLVPPYVLPHGPLPEPCKPFIDPAGLATREGGCPTRSQGREVKTGCPKVAPTRTKSFSPSHDRVSHPYHAYMVLCMHVLELLIL